MPIPEAYIVTGSIVITSCIISTLIANVLEKTEEYM